MKKKGNSAKPSYFCIEVIFVNNRVSVSTTTLENCEHLIGRIAKYFIIDPVQNPVGLYKRIKLKTNIALPDRQEIDKFEKQSSVKENQLYYLCYIDSDYVTTALQRDLKPAQMLQSTTAKPSFGMTNKVDPDPGIIHIKRPKNEKKVLICPFSRCLKKFSETGNLKTHVRSHTDERPYKCPDCNLRFITKRHMQTHAAIHQGLKPFICNVEGCMKKYSRSSRLKIHQQSHYDSQRIYRCPMLQCNRAFAERLQLMIHAEEHAIEFVYNRGGQLLPAAQGLLQHSRESEQMEQLPILVAKNPVPPELQPNVMAQSIEEEKEIRRPQPFVAKMRGMREDCPTIKIVTTEKSKATQPLQQSNRDSDHHRFKIQKNHVVNNLDDGSSSDCDGDGGQDAHSESPSRKNSEAGILLFMPQPD